jgi:hypothetical protein
MAANKEAAARKAAAAGGAAPAAAAAAPAAASMGELRKKHAQITDRQSVIDKQRTALLSTISARTARTASVAATAASTAPAAIGASMNNPIFDSFLEPLPFYPFPGSVENQVAASPVDDLDSLVGSFDAFSPRPSANDDKMQAEFEGAGAGGGSSSSIEQRLVQGQSAKCRASLMRRCMEPDVSAFKTTTAVQSAIDGVQELMQQGLDLMEGLGRLNDLNKRKDELLVSEVTQRKDELQQVKRARDEVESGSNRNYGGSQRTN